MMVIFYKVKEKYNIYSFILLNYKRFTIVVTDIDMGEEILKLLIIIYIKTMAAKTWQPLLYLVRLKLIL